MSDETDLIAALTGSASTGSYPDTVVDRLDKALAAAWNLSSGLDLQGLPSTGSDPGPYRGDATAWDEAVDQVTARYGASPKSRTLVEKAQLLEALVTGIDAKRGGGTTTGGGTSSGGGSTTIPSGETQGSLLWAADFAKGDVLAAGFKSTNWNTEHGPSWPPPIGTFAGRRAIKFALGGGGKRIEVEPNHKTLGKGDDVYCGFWFYLESGFPLGTSSWQVIWQWHGNDTTSPQQCQQVHKGQLTIADNTKIGPQLQTGRWYQVVARVQTDSGGTMNVWLDGAKIADNVRAGLNATPLYLKCGLYHDTSIAGGTIYQTGHTLATGYGAAAAGKA